jgi:hypothetical protein
MYITQSYEEGGCKKVKQKYCVHCCVLLSKNDQKCYACGSVNFQYIYINADSSSHNNK